jgi:hypothetical protein
MPLPNVPGGGGTQTFCGTAANIAFTGTVGAGEVIDWYATATGGTKLATTTTYIQSNVASDFTIYAEARNSATGCVSATRAVFNAVIKSVPVGTISGTASICQNGIAPVITFTAVGGTAPFTFVYQINGAFAVTVASVSGNTATVTAPTGASGSFVYNLLQVVGSGTPACASGVTGQTATVTVTAPTTPTFTQVAAICSGAGLSPLPINSNNGIAGTWSPALNSTATTTYTFTPNGGPFVQWCTELG